MSNFILKVLIKTNPLLIEIYEKNNCLKFKGQYGMLYLDLPLPIKVKIYSNLIILESKAYHKSILNLYKSLIKSHIKGVVQGFKKQIYLKGLGYKFILQTNILILKVGFSHDIIVNIPKSIRIFLSNKATQLTLMGSNYHELTQFIHFIKQFKKPEPYKGKGIFLKNETIIKKEGKKKNDSTKF